MSGTVSTNLKRSSGSIGDTSATFTTNSGDPSTSTNPTLGTIWVNSTSGEMYVCTDATAGSNVWTNVGAGSGNIS